MVAKNRGIGMLLNKCARKKGLSSCFPDSINSIKALRGLLYQCKQDNNLCEKLNSNFVNSFLIVIEEVGNSITVEVEDYIRKDLGIKGPFLKFDENTVLVNNIPNLKSSFKDEQFYNLFYQYNEYFQNLSKMMVDNTDNEAEGITFNHLEEKIDELSNITISLCDYLTKLRSGDELAACAEFKKNSRSKKQH